MLVDTCTIYVRSGRGGHGCVSFRREKYIPKGGPDGGDGGKGGDVVLVADPHLDTLLKASHMPHKRAASGESGQGKSMHGADGADCVVPVPLGTLIYDKDTNEKLADLSEPGQRVIVAKGGEGGLGNEHFKSPTNQTPRQFTEGGEPQERTLWLELKLIADVGLVGLPNAGKSTLLRAISRANPKVADYPFTTLSPHLGIAELPGDKGGGRRLVFADLPGLIEGASGGAGLGHDFLKHIERTKLLVHLVDVRPVDGSDPIANYETIRGELNAYSSELALKAEIVVLSKIDLIPDDAERDRLADIIAGRLGMPRGQRPLMISGATGQGTRELLEACWQAAHEQAATPPRWRGERAEPERRAG